MKKYILILLTILGIGVSNVYSKNATISEAKEILGEDFISPVDVQRVFGVLPKQELPFTKDDLLEIKRLNLILFPQIDKDTVGTPLTAKNIIKMFDNKFSNGEEILVTDMMSFGVVGEHEDLQSQTS